MDGVRVVAATSTSINSTYSLPHLEDKTIHAHPGSELHRLLYQIIGSDQKLGVVDPATVCYENDEIGAKITILAGLQSGAEAEHNFIAKRDFEEMPDAFQIEWIRLAERTLRRRERPVSMILCTPRKVNLLGGVRLSVMLRNWQIRSTRMHNSGRQYSSVLSLQPYPDLRWARSGFYHFLGWRR